MATKTIITTVTLHGPGKEHKPFKIEANGTRLEGKYDPVAYPPGSEVTLDEAEADDILKRFGGEEVTPNGKKNVDPTLVQPPKITTELPKPAVVKG